MYSHSCTHDKNKNVEEKIYSKDNSKLVVAGE